MRIRPSAAALQAKPMLPPWRLYLTALEARFSRTCLSRCRSALDDPRAAPLGRGLDADFAFGGQGPDEVEDLGEQLVDVHRLPG
jgi:hypothetical protein